MIVATWNLQGSAGLAVEEAASRLEALAAGPLDLVALQEVQRGQALALAQRLGLRGRWTWKHWPIVTRTEGLAILSAYPVLAHQSVALTRAPFWSWRRRVGLVARIDGPSGPFVVADVHPSPHHLAEHRVRELSRLHAALAAFGDGAAPSLILGDLNDLPGGPAPTTLEQAGWRDAWQLVHGDAPGPTNWTEGPRAGRPPTQRLDYQFLSPAWAASDVRAPVATGSDGWEVVSDHLPVVADLHRA